jgi:hypothetical protein
MRTPRPLQVPWQVGVAFCLDALLLDIGNPLFAGKQTVEGVGLEDAEGDERGEAAGDEEDDDLYPVVSR